MTGIYLELITDIDMYQMVETGLRGGIGYFIECDLEYPNELHNLHNDYPFAPEKLIVQDNWLPPFCKNLIKNGLASDKTTKLIPTLFLIKKNIYYILELLAYTRILV